MDDDGVEDIVKKLKEDGIEVIVLCASYLQAGLAPLILVTGGLTLMTLNSV